MKIKFLKIRNIASIESGDIDFESGLNDKESGLPASVFLITGDTGSGKSVILDCISMALYGTTPRVKSVSDVKNNSYKNNDGEEISINNIRQYTRIGISWKDDCYTELSFSGNDGIDYVSRFSLGRTSRRNYRNPEWKLTIAATTTIEKKDEIRERIQEAVGLTFEQFSRMAMLAQGQFATFLTGRKEERERVLEQLTATDIFSRYGEAVSNIYRKSRQEKELSAKLYEEFGKKILSEDLRQQLISEQSEKTLMSSTCQRDADKLRKRIDYTKSVMDAEREITRLKSEEASLKAIEDTVDFRKGIALLNLWDTTTSQRDLLSEKIKATEKIASDKEKLKEKKSEFIFLSEDLTDRKGEAKARTERLKEEQLWIESQEPYKQLYSESAGVIEKIKRFMATGKDLSKKNKESKDTKECINALQERVSSQKREVEEKWQKCTECQESIILKSTDRDSLDPSGLRKENAILVNLLLSFNELSTKLDAFESERKETEKAEKEATELTTVNTRLKAEAERAAAKCAQTEKKKNEAESRYVTMHLSVEKNFKGIRRRLAEEHAANCPLCGQSISSLLNDWDREGYFADILAPLEEEKKKLADAYAVAKKEADESSQKMNTSNGKL
ncbi:MAG: SMC family ATPase, partial [Muribaculaceae bacterium]|nr:SMC family ATPase [Muribaculaceae bacterium]